MCIFLKCCYLDILLVVVDGGIKAEGVGEVGALGLGAGDAHHPASLGCTSATQEKRGDEDKGAGRIERNQD